MKKPAAPKNERKAIKVTDPNDKRLRAYNDSNELNKKGVDMLNQLINDYGIKPIVKNKNKTLKRLEELNKYSNSTWRTESKTKDGRIIPYSKIAPVGFMGDTDKDNSFIVPVFKKPVQPYELVKKKPTPTPTPKPKPKPKQTSKPAPKVESSPKQPQKTVAKEDKKFYQGRAFVDSTGLRPNYYTKSEVNAAVAKKKKK